MDIEKIKDIFTDRIPDTVDARRKYGILIPLIYRNNELHLVYQVRASTLSRQPGEISFPGGGVEGEESFKECAIRECMEELLIERDNIKVFGEIDIVLTSYKALIHTFVGELKGVDFENINANKDEVDHLFTIPLSYLLENEPYIHTIELEVTNSTGFPYELIPNGEDYKWDIRTENIHFYEYKGYVVWGLTGQLTKNFIDIYKGLR